MTQEKNNICSHRRKALDQIDLIELMLQLWRGKITIALCIFITLVLALVHVFFEKPKWTSIAIVTQPEAGQIAPYYGVLKALYGKGIPNEPITVSENLNNNVPDISDIQQSLIERFNSSFAALSDGRSGQTTPENMTIDSFVKGKTMPLKVAYTAQTAELARMALPLKLTYTAETAYQAQKKLTNYIDQIDGEISQGLIIDLHKSIVAKKTELQHILASQELIAAKQKTQHIAQIKQALTIAIESDIKRPEHILTGTVSQDTMFLLGSDALSAMVKNEATRPIVLSDGYYQTLQKLITVTGLETGNAKFQTFRYVLKPTLPSQRDAQGRILFIMFAVLLGGILGAAIVFVRFTFTKFTSGS
ncbi:TPA: LPS O-antigen chain length determinant protein WzzB [Kluyvera cryocrescens]